MGAKLFITGLVVLILVATGVFLMWNWAIVHLPVDIKISPMNFETALKIALVATLTQTAITLLLKYVVKKWWIDE